MRTISTKAGLILNIIRTNELSDEQTRQIHALEERCIAEDGLRTRLFLSNEINYDRSIPVFFMAFDDSGLTGFLTVFIPTPEEAEITALVRPDCRRKGIFTALEAEAGKVIAGNGIGRTLYFVQSGLGAAAAVLRRAGISEIQRTEYRMTRNASRLPELADDSAFRLERVTKENVADYRRISDEIYGDDSANYVDAITSSEDRFGYILYRDGRPVGVYTIGIGEKVPFICGVAVAKCEQGNGYGKRLTAQACHTAAAYGDMMQLEVDSENPRAYHIYKAAGFETDVQIDYYRK